ncbi:RNA pseudouridine synthase 7 [Artemisia annua]|uniref:RNA pseudouridine synthase 7 n=1 Tax=Artemisia annua TaxID=35608 RepID=A0A2U1NTU0_ARTAN|nr:RNA pseudouridine synthase 7 [Artemisia annua]
MLNPTTSNSYHMRRIGGQGRRLWICLRTSLKVENAIIMILLLSPVAYRSMERQCPFHTEFNHHKRLVTSYIGCRHEPPVMASNVTILHEGEDVLTVCKPASVPVHPCGQYRKNTVVGILQAEHDLAPLFPIHRLDRLVSGLLILARSASQAEIFRQQIESGLVQKQYIAKVVGEFPEEEQVVNLRVNFNAREGRSTVEAEDMDENGNSRLNGKAACTKFTRICTNGKYSIVSCHPITGRTHQIRVHLQSTGHPIANDALYLPNYDISGSRRAFTAHKTAVKSTHSLEVNSSDNSVSQSEESIEDFEIDPMCTNCPNLAPIGYDGSEEGLWLHCVRYSGPDWVYECPYPDWASLT